MSEIQELAQHIQDFPALVHKARMDKGITNEELAELSGISYSAVCKMQSGERDPKLYDAVAVMKAVGISADQVFDIQPPASAPSAMQERIHELELDNAVSSGDVVRLKQVNGLCTQRLDAVIRQRDHYKRWSVFSSIFAAILSLFLIVYLFFDFRNPRAGFILQDGPSAFAWLVILLVSISIGVCSIVGYFVLRDTAKETSLRKSNNSSTVFYIIFHKFIGFNAHIRQNSCYVLVKKEKAAPCGAALQPSHQNQPRHQ